MRIMSIISVIPIHPKSSESLILLSLHLARLADSRTFADQLCKAPLNNACRVKPALDYSTLAPDLSCQPSRLAATLGYTLRAPLAAAFHSSPFGLPLDAWCVLQFQIAVAKVLFMTIQVALSWFDRFTSDGCLIIKGTEFLRKCAC